MYAATWYLVPGILPTTRGNVPARQLQSSLPQQLKFGWRWQALKLGSFGNIRHMAGIMFRVHIVATVALV